MWEETEGTGIFNSSISPSLSSSPIKGEEHFEDLLSANPDSFEELEIKYTIPYNREILIVFSILVGIPVDMVLCHSGVFRYRYRSRRLQPA